MMDENTKQKFSYIVVGINYYGHAVEKLEINDGSEISWNDIRGAAMKMQQRKDVVRIVIDVAVPYVVKE